MRVGILTAVQPLGTPYSQAHRYVTKNAALALLRRAVVVEIIKHRLYQERSFNVSGTHIPTVTEKQYARPAVLNRVVRRELTPTDVNPNLDLAYPEPMRVTVHHAHFAMQRECLRARKAKRSALRGQKTQ